MHEIQPVVTHKDVPYPLKTWLDINRHGKLASDQWLTLVTEPLWLFIMITLFMTGLLWVTPFGRVVRYLVIARWAIGSFPYNHFRGSRDACALLRCITSEV